MEEADDEETRVRLFGKLDFFLHLKRKEQITDCYKNDTSFHY